MYAEGCFLVEKSLAIDRGLAAIIRGSAGSCSRPLGRIMSTRGFIVDFEKFE